MEPFTLCVAFASFFQTYRPWIFLFYGLLKLVVGLSSMASEKAAIFFDRIPLITELVTTDRSHAGHTSELIITLFGVYTLFEGLFAILKWERFHNFLSSPVMIIGVSIVFGLAFVINGTVAIIEARKKTSKHANYKYISDYWSNIFFGLLFFVSAFITFNSTWLKKKVI